MWCSDPFVNYLRDFGYSIVRLPRRDIYPLEVYSERGGSLDYVGKLTTVFYTGDTIPLPQINRDVPTANISGRRTSSLDSGIALTLLGSILSAMGGSQMSLNTHYQHARSIMFEFHEVLQDVVEPAKLEQYLADARISPFSPCVNQLLDASKIFVTTATLKSKQLTVEAKADNKVPLELHVPTLQGSIGGNVNVSGKAEITSKIFFEGKENLVFGFQALQLFYINGSYHAYEVVQLSGGMRGGIGRISDKPKLLESEGPFVRLHKNEET